MQINSSTDKALATQPINQSGMAGASAAVNNTETASSAATSGKASRESKQIAVLTRWGVAADISKQLTRQDQAERSVRQVYNGLEQLKRQLTGPTGTPLSEVQQQQAQKQLKQLDRVVQQRGSELTSQLEPRPNTAEAISRYLAKVDLVSERRQPEYIQILLGRTGNAVSVQLPAGQSTEENLQALQQAFAPQQISVKLDQQQRLHFSTEQQNARKLQEPWLMSGEGVRIAAGNPVSVQLQQPDSALTALSQSAERAASIQAYRAEIQNVQQRLKESLMQIQSQRQGLAAQLQQAQGVTVENTDELEYISQQLRMGMSSGSSTAISAVMAQANVTRNLVEFGLSQ